MQLISPILNFMTDSGIGGDVTSKQIILTSPKHCRQNVHDDLLSFGIDITELNSPRIKQKSVSDDSTMSDLDKKLDELEKRTASLQLMYDDLLGRATDLESRSKKCEEEYAQKKFSFDIFEFLIKQDGRSQAMFNHVSLFFYVLITKLRRQGIQISSTTELWTRLEDSNVKSAFNSTVINLGFSKEEMNALNMILDTLHDRDLTVNVNDTKVDTDNLTAKLHDLSSEFSVDETEGGDAPDNANVEYDDASRSSAQCDTSRTSDYTSCASANHSATSGSGDSYEIDSLLLYLQIQKDLDPLVKSALRRAVAVAHCARVPESVVSSAHLTLQNPTDVMVPIERPQEDHLLDEPHIFRSEECRDKSFETPFKFKNFRPHFFDEIESDDDFMDMVTSTPKPLKPKRIEGLDKTNNALDIDIELFGQVKTKTEIKRRPETLQLPKPIFKPKTPSPSSRLNEETVMSSTTLNRIEHFITSQRSSTPEEGRDLSRSFRSFYKRRLKRKTEEIVKAERESIKSLSSPVSNSSSVETKHHVNFKLDPPTQLPKLVCGVYEGDRVDDFDGHSDSECNSASSSLLSSFYFTSENGSSFNPATDDERSVSLHEELSELGYFSPCSRGNRQDDSTDTMIQRQVVSPTGSDTKTRKEHVNFFSSPNANPYAYDFDADYYMLWPGQEMEIELKDLSSEIRLESEDLDELVIVDKAEAEELEKSNHSFTSSLRSDELGSPKASKYDKWLLG